MTYLLMDWIVVNHTLLPTRFGIIPDQTIHEFEVLVFLHCQNRIGPSWINSNAESRLDSQ